MPYWSGKVEDCREGIMLYLRGTSLDSITACFGDTQSKWLDRVNHFGRFSIVGTTVKNPALLSQSLTADEKITFLNGKEIYACMTVGDNCILGADLSLTEDQQGLKESYGTFKQEALNISPNYQPTSVNTDGWSATRKAWKGLFNEIVQHHLRAIGSKLQEEFNSLNHLALCRQMNLVEGSDEHILPKNVALMMFNAKPSTFFPDTAINIVEFPHGLAGSSFIEKNFDGPIQQQLMDALTYLKAQIIKSKTIKIKGEALSKTFFNYPFEALEEALANAVYHKNYELREPIEVRILPEAIEIISYGGPDPSIRKDDLNNGIIRARRYRNRRIGEYLKELNLTEGKGTGIPTIKRALLMNGSKPAVYDTDGDERRFFVIVIHIHEVFLLGDGNQDKQESNQDKQKSNQGIIEEHLRKALLLVYKKDYKKQILKRMIDILIYCDIAKTKVEILEHIGLTKQTKNFKEYIEPIVEMGFLKRTLPENPTSRNQKYITTTEGNKLIINE